MPNYVDKVEIRVCETAKSVDEKDSCLSRIPMIEEVSRFRLPMDILGHDPGMWQSL